MANELQKRETRTDPWTEIDRAFGEMRRRFQAAWGLEPFGGAFVPFESGVENVLRPARIDVSDTGKGYRIVAEIPGIPKERLDIRVRGTSVEIRGESAQEKEEKDRAFVHRERTYAGYYRSLELPEPVVGTDVKAKVDQGLLELELPKQHPTPAEVKVKVE